MSDVVLRCPHCGTTQSHPGECEACGEAQVKNWCPNHPGGRWLDGPVCAECEARERREREELSRRPPPAPPPPPAPRRRTPTPPPPAPAPTAPSWPFPTRRRRAEAAERSLEEIGATIPDVVFPRLPFPGGGAARPARGGGVFGLLRGCLIMAFALAVAAVLFVATCLGGGSFSSSGGGGGGVGGWVTDLGQRTGLDVGGTPEQVERGIAAYRAGDRETAKRELGEAAQLYRRLALPLLYLAVMRRDDGDPEGAGELLREAARREPESAVVRRELGGHYLSRGLAQERGTVPGDLAEADFAQARLDLEAALRLDPGDDIANARMACTLTHLGRPAEAAPYAQRVRVPAGADPCTQVPPWPAAAR